MATSRLNKRPKQVIQLPVNHDDWHKLMVSALEAASKVQHPLTAGLRAALASGQNEAFLRKHGIICQADLQRKFPAQ